MLDVAGGISGASKPTLGECGLFIVADESSDRAEILEDRPTSKDHLPAWGLIATLLVSADLRETQREIDDRPLTTRQRQLVMTAALFEQFERVEVDVMLREVGGVDTRGVRPSRDM